MNIYVINGKHLYDLNDDCYIEKEYLLNDIRYSEENFHKICVNIIKELKQNHKTVDLYNVTESLIKYGFRRMDNLIGFDITNKSV